MKASELIERLKKLVEEYGDRDIHIKYYDNYNNIWDADDVDKAELDNQSGHIVIVTA